MNEKTAKRIRKTLKNLGIGHASLNMVYTEGGADKDKIWGVFPLTFIYPKGSFQRMYRNIKNHKPEFHFPR